MVQGVSIANIATVASSAVQEIDIDHTSRLPVLNQSNTGFTELFISFLSNIIATLLIGYKIYKIW
jgi:hypothetical protein